MNFNKYYGCVAMILTMLVSKTVLAQGNIDSFVNTLHNTDAKWKVEMVLSKVNTDSGILYMSIPERLLTSINVIPVRKSYSKYLLVSKLVQTLDDSERDWYADLLLSSLTRIPSINILTCSTREQWLQLQPKMNVTYKKADVEMWQKYLEGLSLTDKW